MAYQLSKPSEILAPYIRHYWTLEHCLTEGAEHVQRIVPNGLFELSFYLGDLPQPTNANRSFPGNSLVTGQLKDYYDIKVIRRLSLFSVIFQPHGLSMFFDIPMS